MSSSDTEYNLGTAMNEQLQKCIKKSFSAYTVEKAGSLIANRYNPNFVPVGTVMSFSQVIHDVHHGIDGYNGKKMQASPIYILDYEIINFSTCMRGDKYAKQVAGVLSELRTK